MTRNLWHYRAMAQTPIPSWQLYGEVNAFPDILHVERIVDRAAGLDWTIGAHRHLHLHQVMLLTSGDIRLTLDGDKIGVQPPAIINLPRGTVHGFSFSSAAWTICGHRHRCLFPIGQTIGLTPLNKVIIRINYAFRKNKHKA